jgi:hypothetical protein
MDVDENSPHDREPGEQDSRAIEPAERECSMQEEGPADFDSPLNPLTISDASMPEITCILRCAARKYPFMRDAIDAANDIIPQIFWVVYLACTDPTLSRLTACAHPEFHFWITRYHAAHLTTKLPYGLDAFEFVKDVHAFVKMGIYLPRSDCLGES